MIYTFDVKAENRISDVIFEKLNRLYDAKLSGALVGDELSSIIISIGDLFANKIKKGSVSEDEIESAEAYVTGFIGENKDKYFSFNHTDLDRAAKTFLEADDFAKEELEQRNTYAQPVMSASSYEKTFKKLG